MNASNINLDAVQDPAVGSRPAFSAGDWLCLAAAPAFASMALLTGISGGGTADMLCSTADAFSLGGMIPMYLLMSAFHLAPWLKLFSHRRNGDCP
jgi:hypothetical protein